MLLRSKKRIEFLADIIITATEGGTNYWAYSRNYRHAVPVETSVEFVDTESYDEDPDKATWHHVDLGVVARAFTYLREAEERLDRSGESEVLYTKGGKRLYLSPDTRKRYLKAYAEMDAGDLDAGDCDNIVQLGMFGEVTYG